MSKTTQLLQDRRAEIEAEIAPLKTELKEIDAALAAIQGKPPRIRDRSRAPQSIGDQVMAILKIYPQGLPTRQIRAKLMEDYGRKITTRSTSWNMSHLKRQERVILVGELWKIPSTDEAPGSDEPSAPDHHDDGGGTPSFSGNGASQHSLLALPGASPAHPGE